MPISATERAKQYDQQRRFHLHQPNLEHFDTVSSASASDLLESYLENIDIDDMDLDYGHTSSLSPYLEPQESLSETSDPEDIHSLIEDFLRSSSATLQSDLSSVPHQPKPPSSHTSSFPSSVLPPSSKRPTPAPPLTSYHHSQSSTPRKPTIPTQVFPLKKVNELRKPPRLKRSSRSVFKKPSFLDCGVQTDSNQIDSLSDEELDCSRVSLSQSSSLMISPTTSPSPLNSAMTELQQKLNELMGCLDRMMTSSLNDDV
ncbi:hypothetical protein GEMRC1_005468 [Eukaryota sp. GEM-RC1]